MPSTNKTAVLQLNQWVRTDGVSMDDFNADNAAIDAAIDAALSAAPWQRLREVTTSAAAAQVDMLVSDIDFTEYAQLRIEPILPPEVRTALTAKLGIRMRVNDLTGGYDYCSQYSATSRYSQNYLASWEFFHNADSGTQAGGIFENRLQSPNANSFVSNLHFEGYLNSTSYYANLQFLSVPVRWSALTKLSFVTADAGSVIPAGVKFVVFGLK